MSASDFAPLRELADDQHAISESESALLHRLLREHAERDKLAKAWQEVAEARAALLAIYRTGNHRRIDPVLTRLEKAEVRLKALSTPPTEQDDGN